MARCGRLVCGPIRLRHVVMCLDNVMVPRGLDMGCHVAPLHCIKIWLESMGVEPTSSESGSVLS
jgi:hypothetical protein